jgi:hypothetical protein
LYERKGKADSILARKNGLMAVRRTSRKDSATAGVLNRSSASFNHFVINGLRDQGRLGLERRPVPCQAYDQNLCHEIVLSCYRQGSAR